MIQLITEGLSSFYVGGVKHHSNSDSKWLFETVEIAIPDTASRPMTNKVGQPQMSFAIVDN